MKRTMCEHSGRKDVHVCTEIGGGIQSTANDAAIGLRVGRVEKVRSANAICKAKEVKMTEGKNQEHVRKSKNETNSCIQK